MDASRPPTILDRTLAHVIAEGGGVQAALDGRQAEDRLHRVGITVNRNAVPFDPRPPMISAGVRIGTAALASRGFGTEEFAEVADIIAESLQPSLDDARADKLRRRADCLAGRFPLYPAVPGVAR